MSDMSHEHLVLRFRDLGVESGATIAEHRAIITERGSTWWGWWALPNERIPLDKLQELVRVAPVSILLLDTGGPTESLSVYRATLEEVAKAPTGNAIRSPDVSLTPRYYNRSSLRLWFRLSSIDGRPTTDIGAPTLVDCPSWPETLGRWKRSVGSRLRSTEDFRSLGPTMFVVRCG